MNDDALVELVLHGKPERADLEDLRARMEADAGLRARFVREVRLDSELHQACRRAVARPRLRWWRPVGLAAAAMLLVACGWWWLEQTPGEGTPIRAAGAPRSITLPDRTRIDLAAGSELVLRHPREGERQLVELTQGRAGFSVAHGGGTFRIATGAADVVVIGTRFDVISLPGERRGIQVAVQEGRVRVERDGLACELGAGETRSFESIPRLRRVSGRLVAVDAAKRTLALTAGGDARREVVNLQLMAVAHVTVDAKAGDLSDLVVGETVVANVSSFGDLVVGVDLTGPAVTGVLAKEADGTLRLLVSQEGNPVQRLPLDPAVRWTAKGGVTVAAQPATGGPLRAWLSRDHQRVLRIEIPEERERRH